METKKQKRFIKWTAVIMILTMACIFLMACSPKGEEPQPETPPTTDTTPSKPEEPKLTGEDVINATTSAILASIDYDATLPVGFDYSLHIDTHNSINVQGYLDMKATTNSRLYLDYMSDGKRMFALSADDKYLYVTADGVYKRIRGLELASALSGSIMPDSDDVTSGILGMLVELPFSLIFTGDEFSLSEVDGNKIAVITGDFNGITDILDAVLGKTVPEVTELISSLLGGIDIKLTTTINADKKAEIVDFEFTKDGKPTNAKFDVKIDNYNPDIVTPTPSDDKYIESNLINFTINGKVDMKQATGYAENLITTYDYELSMDLDAFAMLRNALYKDATGKIQFDGAKLFDMKEGSIYFNLSHNCLGEGCGCNKVEQANGSILTFAYAPSDFGNNNFYISARPLAILPTGFIESIGLPSLVEGFLQGQFGTTINPSALFVTGEPSVQNYADTYANIPTNINIVKIIMNSLDIIGDIRLDETNGLRVGVDSIIALLDELQPIMNTNINVPSVVKSFFGDANFMYIDVENAAYGVPSLENTNFYEKFMIIDENVGEYKFNESKPGPSMTIEPIVDTNGNIVIFTNAIKMYEEIEGDNGTMYKPLPISKVEYEAMLADKMQIKYNYTTVSGVSGVATTYVDNIYGVNTAILDSAQQAKITTLFTDSALGGTVGGLINLLKSVLKLDISIGADVFDTNITIASDPKVEFIQPESIVDGRYDANKEYKYNDKLNATFNIKLTYGDVVKVVENVLPTAGLFNLTGNGGKNAKVQAVRDFELNYGPYGSKSVKVDSSNYKSSAPTKVTIKAGDEYKLDKKVEFNIAEQTLKITMTLDNVTLSADANANIVMHTKSTLLGTVLDYAGITYDKVGVYNVRATFNTGVTHDYEITVVEKDKVLPNFTANIKGTKGNFKVTFGRTNQISDLSSIEVSLAVEGETIVNGEEQVAEKKTLVFGEDYDIMVDGKKLETNTLTLKAFQGVADKCEIVILNEQYKSDYLKITILATDFADTEIGGGATIVE